MRFKYVGWKSFSFRCIVGVRQYLWPIETIERMFNNGCRLKLVHSETQTIAVIVLLPRISIAIITGAPDRQTC